MGAMLLARSSAHQAAPIGPQANETTTNDPTRRSDNQTGKSIAPMGRSYGDSSGGPGRRLARGCAAS